MLEVVLSKIIIIFGISRYLHGELLEAPGSIALIAAVIVSIMIVIVAIKLLIPSANELLEQSLSKDIEDKIIDIASKHNEVAEPHNLRTRRIGNYSAVDLHIRVDKEMTVESSHSIASQIEQELKSLLGQGSIINIHVEPKKQ